MTIMRIRMTILAVAICLVGLAPVAQAQQADVAKTAAKLWVQVRQSDVNSKEFAQANFQLNELIAKLPENQRVIVATAMMERGDSDATNAAALEKFGADGLPLRDVQAILSHKKRYQDEQNRYWPQRVLVRTYYKFLLPEYETRLSEKTRRQMVKMLADHMQILAKEDSVTYGEQRLMSHMLQAVLGRYAGKQEDVAEMASLIKAMQAYVDKQRKDDVLAMSVKAWLPMTAMSEPQVDSVPSAMLAMGHWDPLVRKMKAASYLGREIMKDPTVGDEIMKQLTDPRDEVREAAATVFSFVPTYKPREVISEMVKLLLFDRGVTVQDAASETLVAHADEAQVAIGLLLKALEDSKIRPGPKRTDNILTTLSYLMHENTPRSQKQRLLKEAVRNLAYAPQGALRALEALGPFAQPAIPAIEKYRDTQADRFTRQRINRHVLVAIDPKSAERNR